MTTGQIILGVILFAAATVVIYIWGLKKSMEQDLNRSLMNACGSRVVKYLKKNDTITRQKVGELIEGMTVGPLWSRQKIKVQDGSKAAGEVIAFLLDQQYIEVCDPKHYRLKR